MSRRRHPVWNENAALYCGERAAWHARLCGRRLAVSVWRTGATVATVEQKRPGDGCVETLARRFWPTADDATLLDARHWCEITARQVPA